jgi:hypothetical protein
MENGSVSNIFIFSKKKTCIIIKFQIYCQHVAVIVREEKAATREKRESQV